MRLAQIVEQKKEKLMIPGAFGRMLGLYESSHVFGAHLRSEPVQMILTTIPPRSWRTVLRVSALLRHYPGQVSSIASILKGCGVNILLMEGYGYLPEAEGWWSAVIDFPALHRRLPREEGSKARALEELKGEIRIKVAEVLSGLRGLYPDSKECDCIDDEPSDVAGRVLVKDSRVLARIEPMKLQRLANDVVEDLDAIHHYEVHRGGIKLPFDPSGPRRVRKLLLCNTEERFIRLVKIHDLAEVDLEVHTKAEDAEEVGVGVLAKVTQLLRDFEVLNREGKPVTDAKGVNIAFTYNYIVAQKPEQRGKPSETSMIKLFLERPKALIDEEEGEQCRVWKDLFKVLLNARRNNDAEPFVQGRGSKMVLWQKRKKTIRPDKAREPKEVGFLSVMLSSFFSPERALELRLFVISAVLFVVFFWLTTYFKSLKPVEHFFGASSLIFLVQLIWPKLRH